MARISSSLPELQKILEGSGLPFGNSEAMRNSQLFASQGIESAARQQDTKIPQAVQAYKANLDKIAQMDQKLSGLYGDPTSNLFIEHAGQRESALIGPENVGFQEGNRLQNVRKQAESDLEVKINDALTFYDQLTTEQARLEKEAAKLAKSGGGSGGTGGTGGKGKAGSGSSSANTRLADISKVRTQIEDGLGSIIGLADRDAVETFLSSSVEFQKAFIRDVLRAGLPNVLAENPQGVTKDVLVRYLREYERQFSFPGRTGSTIRATDVFSDNSGISAVDDEEEDVLNGLVF